MVTGAALALLVALAYASEARASVLVPTYVLPPDSFVREHRNYDTNTAESRTVRRLVGGHMKIKPEKEYGDPAKNSFSFDQKSESGKFVGTVDASGGNVGWNQGIWDDGMLMSSAGEGKEKGTKTKEDDEDKKTLSDQVAEGKYGLIQNEIFAKTPKRPGIVSYEANPETRVRDNLQSLGGLKKEEIWLAEDHLLVLKGGSFPERTKESDKRPWPAIDDYEAPRRQVKLPQKPRVPPPFPVQLADDGPLVFLTPNGSVPAAVFPPYAAGEGEGPLPPPPFPFPGAPNAAGDDPRNTTAGGAPHQFSPFPFLPGNASEGLFPYPPSINGSFPDGFPPGAAFLPPPSNQSDLYDEDDPSIYYPPPYNFSYRAEYNNRVPAGPLVPGIVLPPPPDFFAPLEERTTESSTTSDPITTTTYTRVKPTVKQPPQRPSVHRKPYYKTRPTTTTESVRETEVPTTITTPSTVEVTTQKARPPTRVVQIPSRNPVRVHNLPDELVTRPKTEKPVYKTRTKVTSKPLSVSVIYEEPQYAPKQPAISENPYILYSVPEKTPSIVDNLVTSTPVPLRAYYSHTPNVEVPTTKLQPVYNRKPTENSLASFYFYDEQPETSPKPTYYDGRNYYKTVPIPVSQSPLPKHNVNQQPGFNPSVDVAYGSFDQADALFLWPQKQGPRTLTQEYFSIQKPKTQGYIQQQKRPDFYQQIADIQQTIDLFSTSKPKAHSHRPHGHGVHKPKAITSRPVYQFSYQSKRPDQYTFRAPKLDPEPFRPMVSYSKPFNLESGFNAITPSVSPAYHQQYLIENVPVTTESPTSSRYYPKTKTREEDYDDTPAKEVRHSAKKNRNHIPVVNEKPAVHTNNQQSTTANPISHGYYTKQDERYFDDITKNSFDIFGKKIEDSTHDVNGLAVTPPLGTVRTPIDNSINLQYAYEYVESQSNPPNLDRDTIVNDRFPRPPINPDSEPIQPQTHNQLVQQPKPPSLAEDTLVNDRLPRPQINPDSEFIPIPNPEYRSQQYNLQPKAQFAGEQYDLNRPSLAGDTAVNYRRPLPPINPDAEWVSPVNSAGEGRPGSFVSYRLPGEGAHVYFLTPQAAQAAARERYRAPGYGR